MRKYPIHLCILAVTFLTATSTWAAKLILKDGTTLEGTVIQQEDGYWIHLQDGSTKVVPGSSVSKFIPDASTAAPSSNSDSNAMGAFQQAQNQAASVKSAVAAVAIWQEFIDKYPKSTDLDKAKAELDKWSKMADQGAEKIGDKWVVGDELKQIHAQAKSLLTAAYGDFKNNSILAAVDKLKQVVKIYPNSFDAQYLLGDTAAIQKDHKGALQYYQQAVLLDPQSANALNNLGVCKYYNKTLASAAADIYKACKLSSGDQETAKLIVQNLASLVSLSDTIRTDPKNKQMMADLKLLEGVYGVGPANELYYMLYTDTHKQVGDQTTMAGHAYTGSGCLINRSGLILTNRHVATGLEEMSDKPDPNIKTTLLVYLDVNGTRERYSASLVAADTSYDLALLQLNNLHHTTPFVTFSPHPRPAQGADCAVLGFPLGLPLKVTRGVVSSVGDTDDGGSDVITDAKVNPGNSGGPIVDKYGNLMALTRMKTFALEEAGIESYGGGIGTDHIEEFLKKQNVNVTFGTDTKEMSTEDITTQMRPVTVQIIGTFSKK